VYLKIKICTPKYKFYVVNFDLIRGLLYTTNKELNSIYRIFSNLIRTQFLAIS